MAKSFTPTQAMRNNARRGLALRKKWNRGGLSPSEASEEGVGSGVARARDIINGDLSLGTVKRMYNFFNRHEKNLDPKKREADGGPTAGYIAGLLWGGSAGRAWAKSTLKKEDILKSHVKEISEEEMNTEDVNELSDVPINKALDEELRQATFLVLAPEEVDLHGDIYSENEVRKAKENFNRYCNKANLMHLVDTNGFDIIESYISPVDFILNTEFVKKGSWLATLQFNDEELWDGVKNGEFNGVSIGATARVEYLEETDE